VKEPEGEAVVFYDEFDPMEFRPIHGTKWFKKKKPNRLRTTYNRHFGTGQLLAFYNVHADCLEGMARKRKTARDIPPAYKRLRSCYPPHTRIFVIMDNLSVHKHKDIAGFMEDNNMEAV